MEMVIVYENTEDKFYMDGILKKNLDIAKDIIHKDWDMVFLVDGYEGTGKSVFIQQVAKYCDESFCLDRITFTPKQFTTTVKTAKAYQAVIYDEAYGGLSSKSAMRAVNQAIVKMMTEIRQKNLFIFIVLPTFFDVVKYIALWRSRALIHIYHAKGFERGYFAFYNIDAKKTLYVTGKKYYSYSKSIVAPNFFGRFTNHHVVNHDEYKAKKYKSTVEENDAIRDDMRVFAKNLKLVMVHNLNDANIGLTKNQIAKILGITNMSIHNYLNAYDVKGLSEFLTLKNKN